MTTKPAHILWQELNRSKYQCKCCKFRSFNAAHYIRHLQSSKHFLLTEFASECPRDLKILIASFLPVYKIFRLPEVISRAALRIVWRRSRRHRTHHRVVLPYLTLGPAAFDPVLPIADPHVHTWNLGVPRPYNAQTPAYEIRL